MKSNRYSANVEKIHSTAIKIWFFTKYFWSTNFRHFHVYSTKGNFSFELIEWKKFSFVTIYYTHLSAFFKLVPIELKLWRRKGERDHDHNLDLASSTNLCAKLIINRNTYDADPFKIHVQLILCWIKLYEPSDRKSKSFMNEGSLKICVYYYAQSTSC